MTRVRHAVRQIGPEDLEALLTHRRREFGPGSRQVDRAEVEWLLAGNPAWREPGLPVWVVEKEGTIVGEQAAIAVDVAMPGGACPAAWGVDLMVDEPWRMRGVGPALTATLTATRPLSLAVNLSEAAHRAFARAGWRDLGIVPLWARPLRARASARALRDVLNRSPAVLAGLAPYVAAANLEARALALASRVRAHEVGCFDERLDDVWERVAGAEQRLRVPRTGAWVRWRFDSSPRAGELQRLLLTADGTVIGYAVLRYERWNGHALAVLVDHLVRPRERVGLLAHVVRAASQEHAAALVGRILDVRLEPVLRRLGFVRRAAGPGGGVQLMVYATAPDVLTVAGDRARWVVTAADSDLDLARARPPLVRAPSAAAPAVASAVPG